MSIQNLHAKYKSEIIITVGCPESIEFKGCVLCFIIYLSWAQNQNLCGG